jgi:hypothetical protein
MVTLTLSEEEVESLIQSFEAERDQYLMDYGSNRFSFVHEIAEKVIDQNNQLIQKLETLIGEEVSFD